jgi:hypothetical protein
MLGASPVNHLCQVYHHGVYFPVLRKHFFSTTNPVFLGAGYGKGVI